MALAQTAIVGIGATEQGRMPGVTASELAIRAGRLALEDAGIDKSRIDGLVTCMPPFAGPMQGTDEDIGLRMGVNPAFTSTLQYGACAFSVQLAAAAITAGLCNTVLVVYGTAVSGAKDSFGSWARDWNGLAGLVHIAGPAALATRRHMDLYGLTEEQLGWVSVSAREWAVNNPIAIFREPMTIEDYLAMPYLVEPLRRADLTMVSDGGAAVVVTRADHATGFARQPVYLQAMAQQSAVRGDRNPDKYERNWLADIAGRIYGTTGLGPKDMDLAYLQDPCSMWVLQMLEGYGFCGKGESGAFVADGNIRPGGSLPVNTNGGQLSECYMWNWLHLYEAVRQLRGECGERQITTRDGRRPEVALHAQTHDFYKGAATILSTHAG